ncbi:MAG TPA: potassium-transporting ATPase subunit KdpC [Steroidobacter sp.]|uniref:potassium-transporting ATPase subunit KdpC n=1 Tax=Steroidobacter sp. TaxID=1978227 RepID=UPI002EDA308E
MSELRPALVSFLLLTVVTGVAYPLVVTGIGQAVFSEAANGSLIREGNKSIGSRLIGQPFSDPKYFFGRPSATAPQPYNGAASSGSNQGPTNPALAAAIGDRVAALRALDPENKAPVPIDLVTASASGLDPHISPAAAEYQIARVARMRNRPEAEIRALVEDATEGRTLGILGEPRVNVLLLNLALDGKKVS